ncbi:MAG: Holliday junction resolvase RuvX [Succinivibrio sp.]|nr:Holliday junction resolvase RuvX [Succinivibrio sp.]
MARVLAFDFGLNHIGVACGESTLGTASPLPSLNARDGVPDEGRLTALKREWQPELIVVGLPLNADGSEQPITLKAREFAVYVERVLQLKVVLEDERLTSKAAKEELFERGGYQALTGRRGKERIDSLSAMLILEQYFRQV